MHAAKKFLLQLFIKIHKINKRYGRATERHPLDVTTYSIVNNCRSILSNKYMNKIIRLFCDTYVMYGALSLAVEPRFGFFGNRSAALIG
jgi:hypothetical protein